MYYSYYPILPSLGISIALVVSGFVCTLINLKAFREGLRQIHMLELVLATLGLIVSVTLSILPLLSWCYRFDLTGISELIFGLQGMVLFVLAFAGMSRTRNDPDICSKDMWMMLVATALMIIPWIIGASTETI